jgi:leucyl aminopeptidase
MLREGYVQAAVEGVILGQVDSSLYSSDGASKRSLDRLSLVGESSEARPSAAEIETGRIMAEAVNFARSLGNEPGNVITPRVLARAASDRAEREGLKARILAKEQLEELGMGAILAVARGSNEPPCLIALSYEPAERDRRSSQLIALVGKGVTFDSGGISIKPAESMDEMKFDMCGGAAVIGAMQALARLRPAAPVIGLAPAAENMPSGRSYKPGDVVRSLSGRTIEVVNTDAEGRLLLADAITYAVEQGATHVVDVATLTGACVVALGEVRAGVMGSDQGLVDDLIEAGERCGERLWQMPVDKAYDELIRSDIADVKNTGNRTAGAITAAMFLRSFTRSLPWAHIDIAGTAWLEKEKPYMAKGATGFGVRTLANLALKRGASRE